MIALLSLALKSLLVAGIGLVLLHLTRRRSAAERSAVAHLALGALVLLPISTAMLPSLTLTLPEPVRTRLIATPDTSVIVEPPFHRDLPSAASGTDADEISTAAPARPRLDWAPYAYALPVAALLLTMAVALLRLVALRSRAEVLVEPVWLSALAHAQRRMGLKSGTALLVSDALPSPISWGWARPVIVLSRRALASPGEAEAIIAHELAHVISLDWVKLMLARVATALFWFNPLAWMLAREAHQLREEAADDAVLAAAIPGPDYAQLLVGVARHESRGLLLGAHGVAPGRGSLKRRVGRVLDATLARQPAGRSWLAGFGTGMLVMAAPLAALTVAPRPETATTSSTVTRATRTTISPFGVPTGSEDLSVSRQPGGPSITFGTPDAAGRQAMTLRSPSGATVRFADAAGEAQVAGGRRPAASSDERLDQLVAMKAVGATPAYVAALERAAPWLSPISAEQAVQMRAVGVTPDFIRDLAAAGFNHTSAEGITQARAVGLNGAYARAMAAAGYHGSLQRLIEARALGLIPADMSRQPHGRPASARRSARAIDPDDAASDDAASDDADPDDTEEADDAPS